MDTENKNLFLQPLCFYNQIPRPRPDVDDANVDDCDFYECLEYALGHDNKDEFIDLTKSMTELDFSRARSYIIKYDSANCIAEVLAGNTGIFTAAALGTSSLHGAAYFSVPRTTALLLDRGLSADARADFDFPASAFKILPLTEVLPLTVALRCLRRNCWNLNANRRKSAIKVIITLCSYNMRGNMETLRLLAQNTKELQHEFYNYLRDGKMAEVGGLLMTASNRIISSSTAKRDYGTGFTSITEMRHFLLSEILAYASGMRSPPTGDGNAQLQFKDKLMEMEETLQLLEIFDRIGDKLVAYIWALRLCTAPPDTEVASLIQDAGFDVKAEDMYDFDGTFRFFIGDFLYVLERGRSDECKKKACASYLLPWWWTEKEASSHSRLTDHPFPFPKEAKMKTGTTLSRSTSRTRASKALNDKFLKRLYPLQRPIKRALRLVK